MLFCCSSEILNNFLTKKLTFSFCAGPCKLRNECCIPPSFLLRWGTGSQPSKLNVSTLRWISSSKSFRDSTLIILSLISCHKFLSSGSFPSTYKCVLMSPFYYVIHFLLLPPQFSPIFSSNSQRNCKTWKDCCLFLHSTSFPSPSTSPQFNQSFFFF